MNFRSLLILVLLLPFVNACVGIAVIVPNSTEYNQFKISQRYGQSVSFTESKQATQVDKFDFLTLWGGPDTIHKTAQGEVWEYHDGFNWLGIMPMWFFPIPLAIPVRVDKTSITFLNNQAMTITDNETSLYGFYLGPESTGARSYSFNLIPK